VLLAGVVARTLRILLQSGTLGGDEGIWYDAGSMLPKVQGLTHEQVLIIVGVVLVNAVLSNLIWRWVGAKRRWVRRTGRGAAAALAIANLGLGGMCILHLLRFDPDWMYIALMAVAFVFAYRVGGATTGQYP